MNAHASCLPDVNVNVHASCLPDVNVHGSCLPGPSGVNVHENSLPGVNASVDMSEYTLPQRRKIKGRPRGSRTTGVDGVRKRGYKIKSFSEKNNFDKENLVLEMIVKSPVRGKKLQYDDIDIKEVTDVSTAVLDDCFDIGFATRKLTEGGMRKAERVVSVRRQIGEYVCPVCKDVCGEEPGDRASVYCDSCMNWLHIFPCSGERKKPAQNGKNWFCGQCKKTQ